MVDYLAEIVFVCLDGLSEKGVDGMVDGMEMVLHFKCIQKKLGGLAVFSFCVGFEWHR